jgi:outer membrane protein assembly factor BamB
MTTPPTQAQFVQALAFAERTMTEVLQRHLAERRITPETTSAEIIQTRRVYGRSAGCLYASNSEYGSEVWASPDALRVHMFNYRP